MEEKRVKRRIVLVPVPLQEHVTPMMLLGKVLHLKGFSITRVSYQAQSNLQGKLQELFRSTIEGPSAVFNTSSATTFVCRLVLAKVNAELFLNHMKDPEMQDKVFPELHPLRYKDSPSSASRSLENLLKLFSDVVNNGTAPAFIINSASCLKSTSLAWLQQELQVPVYPIGPLHIASSAPSSLLEADESCIEWLNEQKKKKAM